MKEENTYCEHMSMNAFHNVLPNSKLPCIVLDMYDLVSRSETQRADAGAAGELRERELADVREDPQRAKAPPRTG